MIKVWLFTESMLIQASNSEDEKMIIRILDKCKAEYESEKEDFTIRVFTLSYDVLFGLTTRFELEVG